MTARHDRRAAIALAALLALAGCGEKKRTEIILGVATDLGAPTPLTTVHMDVLLLPDQNPIGQQDFMISGSTSALYELPGTFGVYSESGSPDRFQVVLTAIDDQGNVLVVRKAILTLVPGKTLFVRLGVVTACQGKNDCASDQSCVEGRCASQVIDSARLPDYQTGMEKTLACAGADTPKYTDTSTKQPLPLAGSDGGALCPLGTCQEGVCFGPVGGQFAPTKGPMTAARGASQQIGSTLVSLDDGTVLFVGGTGASGTPVLTSAEIYDPTQGTFAATGGLATARTYFGEAKLKDGRVLVVGGINEGAAALASAEIYDPKTRTFTTTSASLTTPRTFPAAVTLSDGRVLIVGGINQIQSYSAGLVMYFGGLGSAEIYDPTTGAFTATTGALVESRAFAQVVPLAGGDALVMCGAVQGGQRATFERFAGATGTFGATPVSLPAGATGCDQAIPALLLDGRLFVTTAPNAAWLYDPQAQTFTSAGDYPQPQPAQLAAVLLDGRVLFIGASATGTTIGDEAYLFDPATIDFSFTAGRLGAARSSAMTALLTSGDVLIAGGSGDATAEVFHP